MSRLRTHERTTATGSTALYKRGIGGSLFRHTGVSHGAAGVPVLSDRTAGRTAETTVDYQNFYGATGAAFQINKVSFDAGWYTSFMADTETVYISF
jgi:hypothetical protein